MSGGKSASILKIYSGSRSADSGIGRDHAPTPACTSVAPDFRSDLNQAFQMLEEIRGIFESRQTYVLHTLLDLVAIEIRLLQKEQGGQYCHSERDIREAFSIARK